MINYKLIILLLAGVATLAWACKPSFTPEQTAEEITTAVSSGHYDSAIKLADELMSRGNAGLDSMKVERLCQLAVAMVKLGEHSERGDEFSAFALRCYQQAVKTNEASTEAYISELPSDDFREISLIRHLLNPVTAREAGVVYSVNEEGDDISHEHEEYEQ
ncbi:MAG: hypothetical protein HDS64_04675 [Bacteroidales bacterium]|nr:hypothetical protein [Bacteroidales bacterium]MBD5293717.1 hypothetical protein [Bacteroides sp.]MDE6033204.1 hypothetical protein [Muribaculaceae bacterium]MBD5341650.1 hypothetical protein [Bacteroides sp.]MBD5353001.1 hypothetical protein [Bacteroides sp.]